MDPPPTRSASRFLPGTPDTSRSCGSRRPARGTRSALRSAGTPGGDRRSAPVGPSRRPPRISRAAASTALRSSSSESSRRRDHGDSFTSHSASAFHMFPIPATSRWSSSASPSSRVWSVARRLRTIASSSNGSSSTSGPSRRATSPVPSSRIGPFQSTPSCVAPRRTSHGRPTRFAPRGSSRQRPVMRRWLRSTAPPSKRSSRFLPTASTDSSRRPSSRSAIPFTAARGCGVSTSTRSPTSGCKRAAARRSESPSGTSRG